MTPTMSNTPSGYASAAAALTERIFGMIAQHPEIADMASPWDLFKVPGFSCRDLDPTFAQASFALSAARKRWAAQQTAGAHTP